MSIQEVPQPPFSSLGSCIGDSVLTCIYEHRRTYILLQSRYDVSFKNVCGLNLY
jgi:hypothetical protein